MALLWLPGKPAPSCKMLQGEGFSSLLESRENRGLALTELDRVVSSGCGSPHLDACGCPAPWVNRRVCSVFPREDSYSNPPLE